eukprot:gene19302-25950_t
MKFLVNALKAVDDQLPEGNAGLAIKIALSLIGALWWTNGKGADELMDLKAKAEKRIGYQDLKAKAEKRIGYQDLKAKAEKRIGYQDLKAKAEKRIGYQDLKAKAEKRIGYQ